MLDRKRLISFLLPLLILYSPSFLLFLLSFVPFPLSFLTSPPSSGSFLPPPSPLPYSLPSSLFFFLCSSLPSSSLPPLVSSFVPYNIGTELTSDTLLVDPGTGSQHSPQMQQPHSYQSLSLHERHYGTVPGNHKNLEKNTYMWLLLLPAYSPSPLLAFC